MAPDELVETIANAARKRTPEELGAFLDGMCGTDGELRRRVEALLVHATDGVPRTSALPAANTPPSASPSLIGRRVGSYHIDALIGRGGMGEVYRARDTRLGRDVAIKFLSRAFINDPDRLARFEREARVLASLNHPNIATIHGVEEADDIRALIMELVDGETLADVIARGPIPVREALQIAKQIADALEAAHEVGVIHRDLKPANIKVRPDGGVKVLDFGLAKTLAVDPLASPTALTNSPTITSPAVLTEIGVLLGTAAYMSPEQAKGKVADKRSDVWAFGCVVFEMLTGKRAFEGTNIVDVLGAVARLEPDFATLPAALPARVGQTVRLCLKKPLKERIPDMGTVRLALEGAFENAVDSASSREAGRRLRNRRGLAVAALLLVALASLAWFYGPRPPLDNLLPTRFIIRTAGGVPLVTGPLAISPDGRELVYSAYGAGGEPQLFHQSLTGFEPRTIEGGRGGVDPFFSPRGDAFGFYSPSARQFRRMELSGGSGTTLTNADFHMGSSLGPDGSLVFTPAWNRPLSIVRPGEIEAVALTRLNTGAGERSHLSPQILPGNRGVLFTIWSGSPTWDEAQLGVADMQTGEHTIVLRGGTSGRYAGSGHLVFWRGNALMATRFDLGTLTVHGEPIRLVPDMRLYQGSGTADFAISEKGTLAYIRGRQSMFSESFVVDRSGQRLMQLDEEMATGEPAFSPDGKHVALTLYRGGTFAIGVFDLERRQITPIAVTGDNGTPSWASDGHRVAFVSNRDGEYNRYLIRSDGSGTAEPQSARSHGHSVSRSAWSRDGRHVAYERVSDADADIWVQEAGGGSEPHPLIATRARESEPTFSPDARFIAYESDESGQLEVYVRPFPQVETRRDQVSRSGGRRPVWSRDGQEIFYSSEAGLMRVTVGSSNDGALRFGQPSLLFKLSGIRTFDVSPDGKTFVIERVPTETFANEIHVVLNWFEELKQLLP